jgi:hypothetical protein
MTEPRSNCPTNFRNPEVLRRMPQGNRYGDEGHFAAQLGKSRRGYLRFTNGAHRIAILAGSFTEELYRARFDHPTPTVSVRGGVVIVRYPQIRACDWLGYPTERPATVELNVHIPWNIEIRGGASRLTINLCELRLGSLGFDGGASRLEVMLPVPSGTVAVAILGGASNVAIRRPGEVAARLYVAGGATHLTFDGRHFGAVGGDVDLRSRDYDVAVARYDIAVTGGANNVIVSTDA